MPLGYDVEYDAVLGHYVLHYAGEIFVLGAVDLELARTEAKFIVEEYQL